MDFLLPNSFPTSNYNEFKDEFNIFVSSLLRIDPQNNQITPEDKLTVLCEITIDGKDVQQSGQAAAAMVGVKDLINNYFEIE